MIIIFTPNLFDENCELVRGYVMLCIDFAIVYYSYIDFENKRDMTDIFYRYNY